MSRSSKSAPASRLQKGAARIQQTLKRHRLAGEKDIAFLPSRPLDPGHPKVQTRTTDWPKGQPLDHGPERVSRPQIFTANKPRPDPSPQNLPLLPHGATRSCEVRFGLLRQAIDMNMQLILAAVPRRVNRHPRTGPGDWPEIAPCDVARVPSHREISSTRTPAQFGTFNSRHPGQRHHKQMGSGERRPKQSHPITVWRIPNIEAWEAQAHTGFGAFASAHDSPESVPRQEARSSRTRHPLNEGEHACCAENLRAFPKCCPAHLDLSFRPMQQPFRRPFDLRLVITASNSGQASAFDAIIMPRAAPSALSETLAPGTTFTFGAMTAGHLLLTYPRVSR